MSLEVIFSHGKESGPSGIKINALSTVCQHFQLPYQSIDYRGIEDPEKRAQLLRDHLAKTDNRIILVGSSMGAYVSLRACSEARVKALFLMAPAVFMPGYYSVNINPRDCKTCIIHGWQDDIVPVNLAIKFAQQYQKELLLLPDDHVLSNSLDRICTEFSRFISEIINASTTEENIG